MDRLMAAHVTVVGLGGVGSYAAEGLARSGVGRLTLVDFDEVCITNFNRQLHAVEGAVGKGKASLMEERIRAINPHCRIDAPRVFYEKGTSESLLTPLPHFIIDAIDNVTAKMHLIATCVGRGIPIVTCLGASARLDPTRVGTMPLTETFMDPFAQTLRKNLRRKYDMSMEAMAGIH